MGRAVEDSQVRDTLCEVDQQSHTERLLHSELLHRLEEQVAAEPRRAARRRDIVDEALGLVDQPDEHPRVLVEHRREAGIRGPYLRASQSLCVVHPVAPAPRHGGGHRGAGAAVVEDLLELGLVVGLEWRQPRSHTLTASKSAPRPITCRARWRPRSPGHPCAPRSGRPSGFPSTPAHAGRALARRRSARHPAAGAAAVGTGGGPVGSF